MSYYCLLLIRSVSQAFVQFFTEALNMEYSSHGVTIQASILKSQSMRVYEILWKEHLACYWLYLAKIQHRKNLEETYGMRRGLVDSGMHMGIPECLDTIILN